MKGHGDKSLSLTLLKTSRVIHKKVGPAIYFEFSFHHPSLSSILESAKGSAKGSALDRGQIKIA